jgi:opacity protein-like surface antigen
VGRRVVIAILGLALFAPSASASTSSDAIATTALTGAVMGVACWMVDVYTDAESDDGFDRRGWLLGLGASYAITDDFQNREQQDLREALSPFDVSLSVDEDSWGFNARGGYRCHQRVSAEVEVEWLSDLKGQIADAGQGAVSTATYSPLFVSTNAKGYLLTGRFQPYALFGLGTLRVDTESTDITNSLTSQADSVSLAFRLGGGLDVYATKHIAVSLEGSYVLPVTGIKNFRYGSISLGLQYRF